MNRNDPADWTEKRRSMRKLTMLCLIAVGAYLYYQHYGLPSFTKSDEVILFIAGQGCPPCEDVVDYLDENPGGIHAL